MAYLILIRHGESLWNAKGLWTGWTDIDLSEKGIEEAKHAANLVSDLPIDEAFTSVLIRAKHTLTIILDSLHKPTIPVTEAKELNERNYGIYTGKNKWGIQKEVGPDQFTAIRRSWNTPIPNGESLKQVYQRVVPYYQSNIRPLLIHGKNILISAHGNSLRALIKHLENISDYDISLLELKTGEVYVYTIDSKGTIITKSVRT